MVGFLLIPCDGDEKLLEDALYTEDSAYSLQMLATLSDLPSELTWLRITVRKLESIHDNSGVV